MTLRDNSSRAQQAISIFQAVAVVLLLKGAFNLWCISQFDVGNDADKGRAGQGLPLAQSFLSLAEFILSISSMVLMIRWLRRAYWNLHAQHLRLEYSEGWAAGAWFVPFINMYRPYSITKEVWRKTQLVAFGQATSHGMLRAWWVTFLLYGLISRITIQMASHATTLEQLQSTAWGNVLTSALGVAAAVLTLLFLQRVAGFEEQMALQLEVMRIGGAAPVPAREFEEDQSNFEY